MTHPLLHVFYTLERLNGVEHIGSKTHIGVMAHWPYHRSVRGLPYPPPMPPPLPHVLLPRLDPTGCNIADIAKAARVSAFAPGRHPTLRGVAPTHRGGREPVAIIVACYVSTSKSNQPDPLFTVQ